MSREALDMLRMAQALDLAHSAIGVTEPNPRVGCVIGTADGQVLGCGATQQAGGHHAEVMALNQAAAAGADVKGATAWVTLEPCAHFGRTPPCCDALIRAGLQRVVVAVQDPFPAVSGLGIARLRAAGLQVDGAAASQARAAWELNIGFFSRVVCGRPWVRIKTASSLDGRTSLANGASQWITGEAARTDGHAWRKRASAVLTGVGTLLADDPQLDVRLVPSIWQPLRVVLDSQLRTPLGARLFQSLGGPVLLACTACPPDQAAAFAAVGAEALILPSDGLRIDLQALMQELTRRGVNELHVEAGPQLNASLVRAELVDEVLAYIAPKVLGPGRGWVDWAPLVRLDEGLALEFVGAERVGTDMRLRLQTAHAAKFFTPPAWPN